MSEVQPTPPRKLLVNQPDFSLEEIASTLSLAASADIWYDAAAYRDEGPRALIEQAQHAMLAVAEWLTESNPTPALGIGVVSEPIQNETNAPGNRVLITVSGGVASYVCDPGLDIEVFDHDDFACDPGKTGGVPAHFADLAEPLEIPVNEDTPLSQEILQSAAKRLAVIQLQQALSAATKAGLFDEMAANVHPDVINHFCDAVSDEYAAHNHLDDAGDNTNDAAPAG